jgi:hypothetical protein
VAGSGSDSKSAGAEGARSSALRTTRLLAVIAFGYAIGSLGATRDLVNPFRDWARHHSNVPAARLGIASTASLVLVPLLAWMSDRLALRGVRRRTWLLFLSLALAAFWLLFDPESSVGVSTVAGLGAFLLLGNVLHAILGGLAVDTGQRYTATSAVSGARELGIRAAMLAAAIVGSSDTQPPVVSTSRALAMGFGLLAIACGLVREWPSAHKESPREGTFRSRGFWAGVLFLAWLGGLDQVARALVKLRVSSLVADGFVAAPGWLGPLVSLLLAIVYIRFGRRLPARRLPLFALAVGGGTIALAVASFVLPPAISWTVGQVLGSLAWLPVVDFAMRFVSPRASAFGFWCLLTLPRLVTSAVAVPLLLMPWARAPSAVRVLTIACVASLIVGVAAWRLSLGTIAKLAVRGPRSDSA